MINFLNKANLFVIYLFGWFFTAAITFSLFYFFSLPEADLSLITCIKIGASTGLPFGLMFVLVFSTSRKSDKFWEYSKEIDLLINNTETVKDIQHIYKNEFQTLVNMAMGNAHTLELTRLYAILQTRYEIYKKQENKN